MVEHHNLAVPIALPAGIHDDLPCFFCGYNLRSLAVEGVCPECGRLVLDSLRQGWINFADPAWLKRLHIGATLLLWLILATVIFGIISLAWGLWAIPSPSSPMGAQAVQTPGMRAMQIVGCIFWFGIVAANLACVWLLTTRESTPEAGPRQFLLASWIRGLAVCVGILSALSSIISLTPDSITTSVENILNGKVPQPMLLLQSSIYVIGMIISLIVLLLLLIHLRRIARRNPRIGLAKMITMLIWGSVAIDILAFLTAIAFIASVIFFVNTIIPIMGPGTWSTSGPTTMPFAPNAFASSVTFTSTTTTTSFTPATMPTSMPTTMPAGVPAALGTLGALAAPLMAIGSCLMPTIAFVWCICFIIMFLWFRSMIGGAIRENAYHSISCQPSAFSRQPEGDGERRGDTETR